MTDQDVLIEKLNRLLEDTGEIKSAVFGENGRSKGLLERVGSLETAASVLKWAVGIVVAALAVLVKWGR